MCRQKKHDIFVLISIFLLIGSVQGLTLQVSVTDAADNASIPHASIFLDGMNYSSTDINGEAFLNHSGLNDLQIRVVKEGYAEWNDFVAKNTTFLLVSLVRKNLGLKILLYDSDSLSLIKNAYVNISYGNLTQTKLTDSGGDVTFDIPANTKCTIRIASEGYLPREEYLTTDTESIIAEYLLLPSNRLSFVVRDKENLRPISDAEIRIDSVLKGKTDVRGILTTSVSRADVHTIMVKGPGYQTFSVVKAVNQTDAIYPVFLSKALLDATLFISDEDHIPLTGADIYINGTLRGTTNQSGRCNISALHTGSYKIVVKKEGFTPQNYSILISSQGEEIPIQMLLNSTDLVVYVEGKDRNVLPDAMVLINGNYSGVTDNHGQFHTKVRPNTMYNITAVRESYQSISIEKEFQEGEETVSITISMDKSIDLSLVTMVVGLAVGILIVLIILRRYGGRKRRQILRKNEL